MLVITYKYVFMSFLQGVLGKWVLIISGKLELVGSQKLMSQIMLVVKMLVLCF